MPEPAADIDPVPARLLLSADGLNSAEPAGSVSTARSRVSRHSSQHLGSLCTGGRGRTNRMVFAADAFGAPLLVQGPRRNLQCARKVRPAIVARYRGPAENIEINAEHRHAPLEPRYARRIFEGNKVQKSKSRLRQAAFG